jgi:hypothetical protein
MAPALDHDPPADHAAEMRKVSDPGGGAGHAEIQFESREEHGE